MASLGDVNPVAVSYLDAPPAGVAKFSGTMPSGCSFWSAAATGDGFYTVPGDHLNCPIGSYTHAIDLPAERAPELEGTLSLMASIGYVRMEEVPSIPRLPKTPACIVYTPLAKASVRKGTDVSITPMSSTRNTMTFGCDGAARADDAAVPTSNATRIDAKSVQR